MTAEARWVSEADVVTVLDLPAAVDAVLDALRDQAQEHATTMAKTQARWGGGHTLHALGGIWDAHGLVGTKTWAHTGGGATPLLVLWDAESGRLRAIIEAFALGQLRTAAMSGVASQLLAPPEAPVAALIGTGKQAMAQLAAMVVARDPRQVRVFSPTPERRHAFVEAARSSGTTADVVECESLDAAIEDARLVTTVTRSTSPFLHAGMLSAPVHINAVGAISPDRAELARDVYDAAHAVVADTVDDARRLSTEIPDTTEVVPLCDIARSSTTKDEGITVFKAMGIGLADVALGRIVLEAALSKDLGRPFDAPTKTAPRLFGGTS